MPGAQHKQFSRNAAVFAFGTLISRVLGLARDSIIATIPAASLAAFIVAFRLPNMFRELIGEGAVNAAFIPVFAEAQERGDEAGFRRLVSSALGSLVIVLGLLTLLGVVFVEIPLAGANQLEWLTGGQRHHDAYMGLTITVARWTFPYLFFIGLAVFAMAPLFAVRHYATPSWTPALLNVTLIVSCLGLSGWFSDPAYALVVGVWLGGASHVVVNWWAMGRHAGVWRPSFHLLDPGVRRIYALLLPVLIGQSANEVNKLIDTMFAYSIGKEAVNALYLGNRLTQLPLSMFGMAVSAAILPAVARAGARDDRAEVRSLVMQGLRFSFFLVMPSMLGLMVLREPIMRLLFEWGHRGPAETLDGAAAMAYFASGLLAFAWVKVTVSGFYAFQDTRTPVKIATLSILLNIVLNFVLVRPMQFRGLALATTLSFTANMALLYGLLSTRIGALWDGTFVRGLLRMTIASVAMAGASYAVYIWMVARMPGEASASRWALVLERLACVAVPVAVAVALYVALCHLLHVPELGLALRTLGRPRSTS